MENKNYYCPDCHTYFNKPEEREADMEDYYGVGGAFSDHHRGFINVCPECGSEDFNEV